MAIEFDIQELDPPKLQFGGSATHSDPKVGLELAGPFDLRFQAARKVGVRIGLVGPRRSLDDAETWLQRCAQAIPAIGEPSLLHKPFPGFESVFKSRLILDPHWRHALDSPNRDELSEALNEPEPRRRFEHVLRLYVDGLRHLAERDAIRPDVVIACLPPELLDRTKTVTRRLSREEWRRATELRKRRADAQLSFYNLWEEIEETPDEFIRRDFRLALKAEAMRLRIPIQIGTSGLFIDGTTNEPAATRAWNSCVTLYYKAGGIPWRLPEGRLETCFVGISFRHFRTTQRHVVRSSVAQAFSTEGEGFALRGEDVPWTAQQGRNVRLSEDQASRLALSVLDAYRSRAGANPVRLVLHKTSMFGEAERAGFGDALRDVPIVQFVTLVPSAFRLLRFGPYPPQVGTLCTVNRHRRYLFTSGFMPELGTYPGPHVPQPFEIRSPDSNDLVPAAREIFDLTRMNWNSADIRGKWPVTLSYSRRVGGILDEYGDADTPATSFRYFL
jgi:hypothetical protein